MGLHYPTFHPAQRIQPLSAPMEPTEYLTHTLVRALQSHEVLYEGVCAWLTSVCNRDEYVGYVRGVHRQFVAFEQAIRDTEPWMESEFCGTYQWIKSADYVRYKTCLFLSMVNCIHLTFEFQFVTDEAGRLRTLRINWGEESFLIDPYKEIKEAA